MSVIQVFPYAVAILEVCAAAVYLYHHEWRLALVWSGYGLAAWAFAGIK